MRVIPLKLNEEIPVRDPMQLDLLYVYRCPPNTALLLELSRYKGGETNQLTAFIRLEQGQGIDALKLKNGDVIQGIETKDYIVRKVTLVAAATRVAEDSLDTPADECNIEDQEEDFGIIDFTAAA
jgi:hypothetical protein